MPELPEVETALRGIQPYISGAKLTTVNIRNSTLRWPIPVADVECLIGEQITELKRRAKYILMKTQQGSLMLHLGMSGSVRILAVADLVEPGRHDHVDLGFQNPAGETYVLRYHDPRKFGSLLFVENDSEHHLLNKLGPEPLTAAFNSDYLFTQSRNRKVAIKNFIMNNQVVVGVGNIYASEALFLANINPARPAGKLSQKAYKKLVETIKHVLEKAIKVGGTTLRDFTQSDGNAGYFAQQLNVYDREGEDCRICQTKIMRKVIGQRSSFYCPQCQR